MPDRYRGVFDRVPRPSVRPSTTGAEAITFDRPFEHDKKLPVLAYVVRTPSKKKWNAASLLRFALASRLLRIMLCSAAAVGGICSRNSSIPSTERFECRKRHEPSIKMDVIPLSTAAEPDGWIGVGRDGGGHLTRVLPQQRASEQF